MSKNTQIGELINYISVDGSGNVVLSTGQLVATQNYVGTAISNLVASSPATLDTLNELALALGSDPNFATTVATSIGTKQPQLNGTGFVKVTGTTVSYDNATYLTTGTASSTYLPLAGGTLTGALTGTTSIWNGFAIGNTPTSVGTSAIVTRYLSTGSDWYIGSESSVAGSFFGGASAYASVFFGTNPFQFITSGVKRFEIATGGVTSTVGYTGTTGTFSGAISATYGTFTNQVTVASPFTIKDTNPYIQWQNSSATRLGYIQHATNLVMSADSGNVVLTTTSGTFTLTSAGPATFSSSVQSTDFRYTGSGYLTYNTGVGIVETFILRNNGTPVLTLDSSSRATFANTVFVGGNLFFDANATIKTISNYGYGGAVQLLRSDANTTRWARIGMVDATATNFLGGMTINNDTSATFSSTISASGGISTTGSFTSTVSGTSEIRLQGGGYGANYNTSLRSIAGAAGILQFGNNADNYILIGNTAANGYLSIRVNCASESTSAGIEALRLTASGTIQPGANGTQDLGTSSLRWATVYTSDLSLSNGIGDYTIVEGENDLFLYNNKQNKVYKFMLAEVDPADATPKKS